MCSLEGKSVIPEPSLFTEMEIIMKPINTKQDLAAILVCFFGNDKDRVHVKSPRPKNQTEWIFSH